MKRNDLPEFLFKNIPRFDIYPENVLPVSEMCKTTAFFPGGRGLWLEDGEPDIFPEILVLGQDFSTVDYHKELLSGQGKKDIDFPTWRNLIKLLKVDAKIDLNRCFFSNVFMDLRSGGKMTGKFPGFKDAEYVKRSVENLLFQIVTIKPKVIITLGMFAADMLSMTGAQELADFKNGEVLKIKDEGLKLDVNINGNVCTVVALEHPSMRFLNVKRRKFQKFEGDEAEVEMLKEVTKTPPQILFRK